MRRIPAALSISLLGATLGVLAVGAAPAGAATFGPVLHAHPNVGAPRAGSHITSSVPPITEGHVETVDGNGNLTYTAATVATPTDPSSMGSAINVQLSAPSFPGQAAGVPISVSVTTALGAPLQVGHQYGTGQTGSVSVTTTNGCSSTQLGDVAVAQVDQLATGAGGVTMAAIQFVCASGAGGPVQAMYGTAAYNIVPTTPHQGYYTYEQTGAISAFGNDNYLNYLGDLSATTLNQPVVGMAQTSAGGGYWMVAKDGGIFAFGDAGFYGSAGAMALNQPIVGMAATADGKGYWLVAADGGIFAYGDAGFHGSTGNLKLNQPIVGMAATPSGNGYWLVAADGGIFAFGDAGYFGSTGNLKLNSPVAGMTRTADGKGYWFVAADGGIFAFGDAAFHGSMGATVLNQPIVGMASTADGSGYWLVAADGGIFGFNAPYYGSIPATGLSVTDVAGLSTLPGIST